MIPYIKGLDLVYAYIVKVFTTVEKKKKIIQTFQELIRLDVFCCQLCVLGLSLCHCFWNNDNEDWNKIYYLLYIVDIHEFGWICPWLMPHQWSGGG